MHARSETAEFESAADAIIRGDEAMLQRLLRGNATLIRARSTREHHATLLHYVSANGVEDDRQKTPKNAVRIAQILIDAGAEVDAPADVYGGGWATLGLVATSAHPRRAGVQIALIDLLMEHGAAIDVAPRGRGLVSECLANGCPEAAVYLAERGAPLDLVSAAGVGRIEDVHRFLNGATPEEMSKAFIMACLYGRRNVIDLLLERGVDIAASPRADRQTALHFAVVGGQLEIVRLLLEKNAPLEIRNTYGGTVLGQAAWSAAHGGDPDVYIAIIETLIAAGAKVAERHPPINDRVDEVLRRHGSVPDPALWWYGEGP